VDAISTFATFVACPALDANLVQRMVLVPMTFAKVKWPPDKSVATYSSLSSLDYISGANCSIYDLAILVAASFVATNT
jgi:hypothetical protein